jgi:hypothetical protein
LLNDIYSEWEMSREKTSDGSGSVGAQPAYFANVQKRLSSGEMQHQFFASILMLVLATVASSQQVPSNPIMPEPSAIALQCRGAMNVVREFSESKHMSGQDFLKKAKESLWEIYPCGSEERPKLEDYVRSGPDGPGLAFAAIALIPYRNADSIEAMLIRARDPKTNPTTRSMLLNTMPYVLGIGDAMYFGDGTLNEETQGRLKYLHEALPKLKAQSIGHFHAMTLDQLLHASEKEKKDEDYGLALWHVSAYLVGALDLKDLELLGPAIEPRDRQVPGNVLFGVSLASNHNFIREMRTEGVNAPQLMPQKEKEVTAKMIRWWTDLSAKTSGRGCAGVNH